MCIPFDIKLLLLAICSAKKKIYMCMCVHIKKIHRKHILYNDKILEKSK